MRRRTFRSMMGGEIHEIRLRLQIGWCFLLLFTPGTFAQQLRQDAGTRILVPSSARTGTFTSFLGILNLEGIPNSIRITSLDTSGLPTGTLVAALPGFGRFRSTDILKDLGAPVGAFGPIIIESTNGVLLSAVSEVSSDQGPGGFFPGISIDTAWYQGYLTEAIDTGDIGVPATFRTNIGVNNVGSQTADVTIVILGTVGAPTNSVTVTIPRNGMTQVNNVVRSLVQGSGGVTGRNGYLRLTSTQPIIAWASKIENGTGDPSFQVGIGARYSPPLPGTRMPFPPEVEATLARLPVPSGLYLSLTTFDRPSGGGCPGGKTPANYNDELSRAELNVEWTQCYGGTYQEMLYWVTHECCHAHQHRMILNAGLSVGGDPNARLVTWLETPEGRAFKAAGGRSNLPYNPSVNPIEDFANVCASWYLRRDDLQRYDPMMYEFARQSLLP